MGLNFGSSGISLLFVRTKRFWGGWGGGEVPRDFSLPLSPRPTPQSYRGVPWAPSPLLNRLGFRVVWRCPVLFGHTLNQRTLLGICCPSRNRPCLNSWSLRVGVLSSSLFSFQNKIRVRFPQRTRLVFALSEGMSSCVCFWVPLFLSNHCGVLPRPTKFCLALFAASALRLAFSAASLRRCAVFLGFRGSVGRRLAVFLSLSSLVVCFLCFRRWWGHTLSKVPSPSGLTEGL